MNDTTKILIIAIIENIVICICFTILAVIFKKWWIIFFSALFYNKGITTKKEVKDE